MSPTPATTPHHRTPRRSRGAEHLVLRVLGRVVALACLALVLAGVAVTVLLPRATHGAALSVLTGSMEPAIPTGSVVLVRPVDPGTLAVGDVITYQANPDPESLVTHRIVAVDTSTSPTTFTLKGDANRGADLDPVAAPQVRGEVWFHVPWLGSVRDALHGRGGVTLVLTLLLAAYAVSQLSAGWRERRTAGRGTRHEVVLGTTLVLAELDADELGRFGQGLDDLVHRWHGLVLDRGEDQLQVLLAPTEPDLPLTLGALALVHPRRVLVAEPGSGVFLTASDVTPAGVGEADRATS